MLDNSDSYQIQSGFDLIGSNCNTTNEKEKVECCGDCGLNICRLWFSIRFIFIQVIEIILWYLSFQEVEEVEGSSPHSSSFQPSLFYFS